jgi:hypothetical protein
MSKKIRKSTKPSRRMKATASTTSALLAAMSLLGASLGVSAAAPTENAGPATNVREADAARVKLAQAHTTQGTLQRNQLRPRTPTLQSNQFKMQGPRANQFNQQLQSTQSKATMAHTAKGSIIPKVKIETRTRTTSDPEEGGEIYRTNKSGSSMTSRQQKRSLSQPMTPPPASILSR